MIDSSAVVEDFDRTILPNETKIITIIERQPQILGFNCGNHIYFNNGIFGGVCSFLMLAENADLSPKIGEIHS